MMLYCKLFTVSREAFELCEHARRRNPSTKLCNLAQMGVGPNALSIEPALEGIYIPTCNTLQHTRIKMYVIL